MAILTFAAFFLNVSLVVEFLAIPEMVTFLCVHSMLKSEQKKNGTTFRQYSSTNIDPKAKNDNTRSK